MTRGCGELVPEGATAFLEHTCIFTGPRSAATCLWGVFRCDLDSRFVLFVRELSAYSVPKSSYIPRGTK